MDFASCLRGFLRDSSAVLRGMGLSLALLSQLWVTPELSGQNDQRLYPVRWSSPALEREARAHADVLWKTILLKCDGFYYYRGSGLDNLGWANNATPFRTIGVSGANIVKYSGDVQFQVFAPTPMANIVPSPDGMEDVGYAVMSATTFQTGSIERKKWSEAMTVPKVDLRPDAKTTPAAILATYQNGLFGGVVGTSGNIAVHMQRKNGKWYYNIVGILTKTTREEEALMDSDDGLPGKQPHPRCLVPAFHGAYFSVVEKEALWDRFYTGAPPRRRRSVERYSIVKRA